MSKVIPFPSPHSSTSSEPKTPEEWRAKLDAAAHAHVQAQMTGGDTKASFAAYKDVEAHLPEGVRKSLQLKPLSSEEVLDFFDALWDLGKKMLEIRSRV